MKNFRMLLWVFTASLTANPTPAQNWVWVSGTADMYPSVIASSADGSKLAVAVYYLGTNGIYTSTNSGATWLPSSAPNWNWSSIASSADGSRLVAAGYGGVYTSTNFGVTWFSNNVPSWSAVASSADGSRLVAVGRQICISTNSGNVWAVTSAPTTNWCSVASSANGNLLLAGTFGGPAYLSTDSGNTWVQQTNLPAGRWTIMATSADGKMLMAVAEQIGPGAGRIYISTNSGSAWTQANAPTNCYWMVFCSSADGTKMAAIDSRTFVYSTNSGNNWTSNNAPALNAKWLGMASSADGNKMALAGGSSPNGIFVLQTKPAPRLNLKPTGANLTLSWTEPSTNFVLQQSSDLTGWADMTNPPVLNLTNLQNEVALSPTNGSGLYRLKTP